MHASIMPSHTWLQPALECSSFCCIDCCRSLDSFSLQVLGNASRRQVYDIYGTEGLAAGLQVVPSGKNTEALKQEWEGFRVQQVVRAAPYSLSRLAALPCSPLLMLRVRSSQMQDHAVSFHKSRDAPCMPLHGHHSFQQHPKRTGLSEGIDWQGGCPAEAAVGDCASGLLQLQGKRGGLPGPLRPPRAQQARAVRGRHEQPAQLAAVRLHNRHSWRCGLCICHEVLTASIVMTMAQTSAAEPSSPGTHIRDPVLHPELLSSSQSR